VTPKQKPSQDQQACYEMQRAKRLTAPNNIIWPEQSYMNKEQDPDNRI
jgi:hypothetical protein